VARSENQAVQHQVSGAGGLMEVHVATPAVVGGQMEHNAYSFHRTVGHTMFPQVRFDELRPTLLKVATDVVDPSATQVVHNSNLGAAPHQGVDKV
jgi:hypothetical protein